MKLTLEEKIKKINEYKTFIKNLEHVQDMWFSSLVDELNLNQAGDDHLFDYIFNESNKTFEEYVVRYCQYENFFNEYAK